MSYLKIGYTDNLKSRLKQYETHNPDFELLGTLDLPKWHEDNLHKLCEAHLYKLEWFYDCQDVRDIFFNYKSIELDDAIKRCEEIFDSIFTNFANNFNEAVETDNRVKLWEIYHSIDTPDRKTELCSMLPIIPKEHDYYKTYMTKKLYWENECIVLGTLWHKSKKNVPEILILPGYWFSISFEQKGKLIKITTELTCIENEIVYKIKS